MKTRLFGFLLSAVLLAAGILLGEGTVSAHSMPYEETTLILDDYAAHTQSSVIPRQSTLKDAQGAVVRAGLADDYKKSDFTGDGMRFVTFRFNYAEEFVFRAVTGAKDTRDAGELTITGYDIMGPSVRTRSGIHVGIPYTDVTDAYGEASSAHTNEEGLTSYSYAFDGKAAALTFGVDDAGIIRAIQYRSEI